MLCPLTILIPHIIEHHRRHEVGIDFDLKSVWTCILDIREIQLQSANIPVFVSLNFNVGKN